MMVQIDNRITYLIYHTQLYPLPQTKDVPIGALPNISVVVPQGEFIQCRHWTWAQVLCQYWDGATTGSNIYKAWLSWQLSCHERRLYVDLWFECLPPYSCLYRSQIMMTMWWLNQWRWSWWCCCQYCFIFSHHCKWQLRLNSRSRVMGYDGWMKADDIIIRHDSCCHDHVGTTVVVMIMLSWWLLWSYGHGDVK